MPFGRMRSHDVRHMGSEDARAKSGRGERTQACRAERARPRANLYAEQCEDKDADERQLSHCGGKHQSAIAACAMCSTRVQHGATRQLSGTAEHFTDSSGPSETIESVNARRMVCSNCHDLQTRRAVSSQHAPLRVHRVRAAGYCASLNSRTSRNARSTEINEPLEASSSVPGPTLPAQPRAPCTSYGPTDSLRPKRRKEEGSGTARQGVQLEQNFYDGREGYERVEHVVFASGVLPYSAIAMCRVGCAPRQAAQAPWCHAACQACCIQRIRRSVCRTRCQRDWAPVVLWHAPRCACMPRREHLVRRRRASRSSRAKRSL